MFANRFTAVLDACVLTSAAKRDLVLSLAEAEFFRPRWTQEIIDETRGAIPRLLVNRGLEKKAAEEKAAAACDAMCLAFPEAIVDGYEQLTPAIEGLRDPDDRHVVAAAVQCKASIIVTDNLKDFPSAALDAYELEAKSADDFIADAVNLDAIRAAKAIKKLRRRLKRPEMTAQELLLRWEARGLKATAAEIAPFSGLI